MIKYEYNPETLMYEAKDEPKRYKILRRTILSVFALGLVVLYIWLYIGVFKFQLPKTAILKQREAKWEAKMELLNRRLDLYEQSLEAIEDRNDFVYRSLYGLNEIPDEIKYSGLAGATRYEELDHSGANSSLRAAVRRVDALSKRAYIQSKSLDEVSSISLDAGDMIACVPAVPPLLPDLRKVRLSSPFGTREDPVFGGGEYHVGQDFATDRGTPVYASGDGVVVVSDYNSGYGNELVIDHGFGYKTRYAHLNRYFVTAGMKVKRGEKIGEVGNTGKTTGPHLHYEVIFKGTPVNPMTFMDINMPLDEYRAMTSTVSAEDTRLDTKSTSDVIKRLSANGK